MQWGWDQIADDFLKCMSFNEDVFILIENWLELFQLVGTIDKKSALVYI